MDKIEFKNEEMLAANWVDVDHYGRGHSLESEF
jgi:hypothetical protein